MSSLSIVEYLGSSKDGKCGYCKKTGNHNSTGFWAHTLTVQDYQDLINRNWRRSGQYCYQPINSDTCCILYTIKCDAINFNMTRSQKKVIKRVNEFLKNGTRKKGSKSGNQTVESEIHANLDAIKPREDLKIDDIDMTSMPTNSQNSQAIPKKSEKIADGAKIAKIESKKQLKPMKAKTLRIERCKAKLESKGLTLADAKPRKIRNARKSIEDFLNEEPKNGKHKLEVKLVKSEDRDKESFNVYTKYQMKIHGDKPEKLTAKSYERFLVSSPLQFQRDNSSPACGFGSFHHQYYLDGILIAVGVIDILPECVSSVYFYYDPDYDFLSLGTYASLREISLTRELSKMCESLKNYYLGFYIPTCPKMRYKSKMRPSYLLCPETFQWKLLDKILSDEIDKVRYLKFYPNEVDRNLPTENDLPYVLVLVNRVPMKYKDYRRLAKKAKNDRDEVLQYSKFVGKILAQRMVLYRA